MSGLALNTCNRGAYAESGRRFVYRQIVDIQLLWCDYVFGKQTAKQLSEKYQISVSTVHRRLSEQRTTRIISSSKQVVVLIDTVYWGRNFGVVVFKDWRTKRILWRKFGRYETLADYQEGVDWLITHDFCIDGIVCDGLRGMFKMLSKFRVQMCQFHQIKIIDRYLTKKPERAASIELQQLMRMLTRQTKSVSRVHLQSGQIAGDALLMKDILMNKARTDTFINGLGVPA